MWKESNKKVKFQLLHYTITVSYFLFLDNWRKDKCQKWFFYKLPTFNLPSIRQMKLLAATQIILEKIWIAIVAQLLLLCYIQIHWHLDTTNSLFWLVNTLLWKFDTLSKKRNENDKKTNFITKSSKKMSKKYMKALSN